MNTLPGIVTNVQTHAIKWAIEGEVADMTYLCEEEGRRYRSSENYPNFDRVVLNRFSGPTSHTGAPVKGSRPAVPREPAAARFEHCLEIAVLAR